MKKRFMIFLLPALFGLGVLSGFLIERYFSLCNYRFSYINPGLDCEGKIIVDKSNPIILKEKLNSFIAFEKDAGRINNVSVYFRDLHNGPTMGINESEAYIGASLLKIPTAIAFFKLAEEGIPDILERRLHFSGISKEAEILEQVFKPNRTVQPGSFYTVEDLIFNSLVYSDNMSNEVLKASLKTIESNTDLRLQVFRELGLVAPTGNLDSSISVRSYSSIFRQLYSASYLSLEHSDKFLSILAESEFDQGITAGIPKGIKVANKFGERFIGEEKQLHDCGIVYYPDNPYLICIMTRGNDFQKLAETIGEISKMVYEEMDSRRLK